MSTAVIILAAGRGTRAKGPVPKQWQMLGECTVLERTLQAFSEHPALGPLVVVTHPDDCVFVQNLQKGLLVVHGGETRSASVQAGLGALQGLGVKDVLIHDGARPFVTSALIDALCVALKTNLAAAPALRVTDALWRGGSGFVLEATPRDGLYLAQTPQAFDFEVILSAYAQLSTHAADDVEVARRAGVAVKIIEGEHNNIKITEPNDFARALTILNGYKS
ncbi:MAG: 2-C-methyl-D-erythritol 4-phosphate cytidylyltransferase [Paracoccaceae bacterium]|nr:2-C-methyl-D-erythritol 4-phosphate cytidylyltransferase [Paracoccaceae bacterium]